MKFREGKNYLIKNGILRNIHPTTRYIKAFIPFVHVVVPKESTPFGPEGKLPGIIRTDIGPAGASKYSKRGVIWLFIKQGSKRCRVLEKFARCTVYKICSS
jgi:hypothetical protein